MKRVITSEELKELYHRLTRDIDDFSESNELRESEKETLNDIAEGFVKYYKTNYNTSKTDVEIFDKYFESLELVYDSRKNFDRLSTIKLYYRYAEDVESEQKEKLKKKESKPKRTTSSFNETISSRKTYSYSDFSTPSCGGSSTRSSSSGRSYC